MAKLLLQRQLINPSHRYHRICRTPSDWPEHNVIITDGDLRCCGGFWRGYYALPRCPCDPGGPDTYITGWDRFVWIGAAGPMFKHGSRCYHITANPNPVQIFDIPPGGVLIPGDFPRYTDCTDCCGSSVLWHFGPNCAYGPTQGGFVGVPSALRIKFYVQRYYKYHKQTCEPVLCYEVDGLTQCDDSFTLQNTPCCLNGLPGEEKAASFRTEPQGVFIQHDIGLKEIVGPGVYGDWYAAIYETGINQDGRTCNIVVDQSQSHLGGFCNEDPPVAGLDVVEDQCCGFGVHQNEHTFHVRIVHTFLDGVGPAYLFEQLDWGFCEGEETCVNPSGCHQDVFTCDTLPLIYPVTTCFDPVTYICDTGTLEERYPDECVSCRNHIEIHIGLIPL